MEQISREEFIKKMNKLKRVYDTYINEWRIELENYLKKVDSWTIEDTINLQMLVHKLTGTGTTYGYPDITDAGRSLEYKLAFANQEFKIGIGNPNKNLYIISELRGLIRSCADIHAKGEVSRMERDMYGDDMDDLISSKGPALDQKTILVVDDHDIILKTLEASLGAVGFNVITASDGDDALLIMQKKMPDLVVLDRMMPNLDGLAVLKTMRKVKNLSQVPVIFLTALYDPAHILEAEKLGTVDYVAKPFDPDEFSMRCMRILKLSKE